MNAKGERVVGKVTIKGRKEKRMRMGEKVWDGGKK